VGECFYWYRPSRVVPDKGPLNYCVCSSFYVMLYCSLVLFFSFNCELNFCHFRLMNEYYTFHRQLISE